MISHSHSSARGFSIIAVLFILVVLAGFGVVMAQLSITQQVGSALSIEGRQAWNAARDGLEWGRARAANGHCTASTEFELRGFDVRVTCAESTVIEGEDLRIVTQLVSRAQRESPAGPVAREGNLTLWRTAP